MNQKSFCLWMFLINLSAVLGKSKPTVLREYHARQDFTLGTQFSIMDSTEKHLNYRIESRSHIFHKVEVIRYPEKEKTARLNLKPHWFSYHAEIWILDEKTNTWAYGDIEQSPRWFTTAFNIQWNGHRINMTHTLYDTTREFRDEGNTLLASYQTRPRFLKVMVDLKIYSNVYPDEIYFLALSADAHLIAKQKTG